MGKLRRHTGSIHTSPGCVYGHMCARHLQHRSYTGTLCGMHIHMPFGFAGRAPLRRPGELGTCKLLPPLSGKSGLTPWVRTTYEQSLRNFSIRKPRGADSQQLMSSGAWTVSRSLGLQHRLSEPPTALRASGGPGLHTITVWWSQSYQLIRDQSVAITAHALKRSTIQGWSPAFATAGSA